MMIPIRNEPVVGGPVYSCSVSSRYPDKAQLHRYEYACVRVGTVVEIRGVRVQYRSDRTGEYLVLHKNSNCRTFPVDGSCELPGGKEFSHFVFSEDYAEQLCREALRQLRYRVFAMSEKAARDLEIAGKLVPGLEPLSASGLADSDVQPEIGMPIFLSEFVHSQNMESLCLSLLEAGKIFDINSHAIHYRDGDGRRRHLSLRKLERQRLMVQQCASFGYKLQYYTFSREYAHNLAVDYVLAMRSFARLNVEFYQRLVSRSWLPVEGLDVAGSSLEQVA